MLGGAVVERRALTHQPPHVFLLSQPVRRVGSFPRGGEWTTCAVVCRPLAHTHQPSSRVEGGAVVEHVALTHQPPLCTFSPPSGSTCAWTYGSSGSRRKQTLPISRLAVSS